MDINALWINFAVALGIGLIIGAERERNKDRHEKTIAGVRTFTIAALLGAATFMVNIWLHIAIVIGIMTFVSVAYFTNKSKDPGLTTEISLLFTVILGGLTITNVSLAASLAILTTLLLLKKKPLHGFVAHTVTKQELYEFLMLAAATLIILPIVPNDNLGPFEAINPRNLWLIVIFIMAINVLSHLAIRLLGQRIGLPIVGFFSGFISSIATVSSMGEHTKHNDKLCNVAVCGATFSSLATIFYLTLLLSTIHLPTLNAVKWPLIFGAISIGAYGTFFSFRSLHQRHIKNHKKDEAFSIKTAIWFTVMIAIVLIVSAALKEWFGQKGLILATGIAGLADCHSPSISVASMASTNKITAESAVIPILVAASINTISKSVMAFISGVKAYAIQVSLGLLIQVVALWTAWWIFI